MKKRGLISSIRADLVAHDRFAIGPGWVPAGEGMGAWWHRYRRNHHAAGIMILYRIREWGRRRPTLFLTPLCERLMEIVHGTHISREVTLGTGVYFPHGDAHIHGHTVIGDCVIVGVHTGIGLRGSFFSEQLTTEGPDDRRVCSRRHGREGAGRDPHWRASGDRRRSRRAG